MFFDKKMIEEKNEKAKKYIEKIQNANIENYSNEEEKEFIRLAQWLLSTENESIFGPGFYENHSFHEVASMLHIIDHALVDDGAISTCKVNFDTLIFFIEPNDFSSEEEYKKAIQKQYGINSHGEIQLSNIKNIKRIGYNQKVNDFIEIKKQERIENVKRYVKFEYILRKTSKEECKKIYGNSYPDVEIKDSWFEEWQKINTEK